MSLHMSPVEEANVLVLQFISFQLPVLVMVLAGKGGIGYVGFLQFCSSPLDLLLKSSWLLVGQASRRGTCKDHLHHWQEHRSSRRMGHRLPGQPRMALEPCLTVCPVCFIVVSGSGRASMTIHIHHAQLGLFLHHKVTIVGSRIWIGDTTH